MRRDSSVIVLGQDVAKAGGTFGATRNLLDEFGPDRVRDMPICEQSMLGAAVGAALVGLRPIVEVSFLDFLLLATEPLVNQAAKYRYFSGGRATVPMVVKAGIGTGLGMGAQHTQSLEAWYAHVPGLKVVWATTATDLYGLFTSAIRDPNPVLFLESLEEYRRMDDVPDVLEPVPIGRARIDHEGDDATLVTYGTALKTCQTSAAILSRKGIDVEIIDLRSLKPVDVAMVRESVEKTGRCVIVHDAITEYGPGGELASEIAMTCFRSLMAPVKRVGSPSAPSPQMTGYERMRLPSPDQVVRTVEELMLWDRLRA